MKTYSLLFAMIVFMTINIHAQGIRHVKGVKSVEVGAGKSALTTMFYGGYSNYFSSKLYGKASAFYVMGEDKGIKFNVIGVDVAPVYNIATIGEFFYLNVTGGITVSYDRMNPAIEVYDNGNIYEETYGKVKFGVFGGFETETFITDDFVFVLGFNSRLMFGNEWGKSRWFGIAGIRYNL